MIFDNYNGIDDEHWDYIDDYESSMPDDYVRDYLNPADY